MYCLFKTRVIYELRDLRTIFFEEIFIMLCGIRNVTAQKYRQRFIFTPRFAMISANRVCIINSPVIEETGANGVACSVRESTASPIGTWLSMATSTQSRSLRPALCFDGWVSAYRKLVSARVNAPCCFAQSAASTGAGLIPEVEITISASLLVIQNFARCSAI